jgi:hypothetical protein
MKNKLLLLFVIAAVLFQQKAIAQLPEISTAGNPVWYFIQVVGEGSSRENRVFDVQGNYVYGASLNKTSDAQLFRFEKNGNNYIIISKPTGKKINVGLNGGEEAFVLSETGLEFKLNPLAAYYYDIEATQSAVGGDASKKWAHQANSNSSYKIILVNTTWSSGLNSQFSFIPYEALNLEYSTAEKSVWYAINSAKTNSTDECITDISFNIKIAVDGFVENNENQLWKLVQNGSKVNFVNKATGKTIQNRSDVSESNKMYNYTQLTETLAGNAGWTLNHIRAGQFSISGLEEDNITRYLNAAEEGVAPETFDSNAIINSGFAWKFKKINTTYTAIPTIGKEDKDFLIYSVNRRIVVEGAKDYTIRTIHGTPVNKNTELPVGIYLVTVNGKTSKLLVK